MNKATGLMIVPELMFKTFYRHELEREGVELTSVQTVPCAIEKLRAQEFDLVLMDIDRQSSVTARLGLQRLRDSTKTSLIVLGSFEAMSDLLNESKSEAGEIPQAPRADAFVIKDTSLSELRIALDELLPTRTKSLSSVYYSL